MDGKAEPPIIPVEEPSVKTQKDTAAPIKPKTEKSASYPINSSLKEQSDGVIKEIGVIITTVRDGVAYFSEDEMNEARQIIRGTKLDEKGINDLKEFKIFLSAELTKREAKKAA